MSNPKTPSIDEVALVLASLFGVDESTSKARMMARQAIMTHAVNYLDQDPGEALEALVKGAEEENIDVAAGVIGVGRDLGQGAAPTETEFAGMFADVTGHELFQSILGAKIERVLRSDEGRAETFAFELDIGQALLIRGSGINIRTAVRQAMPAAGARH